MSKKFKTMLLTLAALAVSVPCFANITQKEAIAIGKKEVPTTVVNYGTKTEEKEIKVFFFDNSIKRNYEVKIDIVTGKVLELEITGSHIVGSTTILKTLEDARAIALEKYPDAQNLVVKLEKEGNNSVYVAEFATAKFKEVELKINPVTGAIGHEEMKYR